MKSKNIAKIILLVILALRAISLLFFSDKISLANSIGGVLYIVAVIAVAMNKKVGVVFAAGVIILHAIYSWIADASSFQITQTIIDVLILLLAYAAYKNMTAPSNSPLSNPQV